MERLAEQEMEAAAAEEEQAVKLEHDRRRAAAIALLNQHNPDWFASEAFSKEADQPQTTSSCSRRGSEAKEKEHGHQRAERSLGAGSTTGDEKLDAAAAVARQRALAMAILNEHNSDWFGELEHKAAAASRPGSGRSSLCESGSTVKPTAAQAG